MPRTHEEQSPSAADERDDAQDTGEPRAKEKREAEDGPQIGTRLSAEEIHENIQRAAEEEMRRPFRELLWSSIAAGLTIGFSIVTPAFLTTLPGERYHPALIAAGYPLGFIFVVLARQQLFTEQTLEPVIPLLQRRNRRTFNALLRLWGIVLVFNLVGTLIFAALTALTPVITPEVREGMMELSRHATEGGFWLTAYKAVFAGWLIALMAWLVASTRFTAAQIVLVWLTTAPISALGFRHCIAGSVEAFFRAISGDASWGAMLGEFLVPAILGNIVGGVTLVALLNHGQVALKRDGWVIHR